MIQLQRPFFLKAFKLFDLLIMAFSFLVITWAVFFKIEAISFGEFLSIRVKVQNFVLFSCFLLFWHMSFSLFGLYHSRRFSRRLTETFDVIKATSFGTLIVLIGAVLFRVQMLTPIFLLLFWGVSSTITIACRLFIRYLLEQIRLRGRNLRYMLIVGTNSRAVKFAKETESKKELGCRIIGFVDKRWHGIDEVNKNGYRLVADFQGLPSFLRDNVVDEIVMALPLSSLYQQASQIIDICEEQGIVVRYLSDIFNHKLSIKDPAHFEEEPLISHSEGTLYSEQIFIKRLLDATLCSVLLLLFLPLFLLVTFLIKVTSSGPAFFIQERVGLNKRRFRLYKFRTMVQDAEQRQSELEDLNEVSGPVFKIKNDPRITWIGNLLRKSSIDELPQLINILKGEMSVVGPRPLPERDYNGFDTDWHRRRFSVMPGITCLWQVNGRSDIPFEKWMELDMQYIDNWSLWLDLKILAKTVPAVLKLSGSA